MSTCTWHDNLVAGDTLGGEFVTVAVVAEQSVVLAGERLISQRAVAVETAEAMLVVMPVLIEELLAAEREARTRTTAVIVCTGVKARQVRGHIYSDVLLQKHFRT